MAGVRAQRKAERPGEILGAAFDEFVLNGYAATRLEDVAARAGVTKGLIYNYFEGKERLFEEAVRAFGCAPLFEAVPSDGGGTLAQDLEVFLRRVYAFIAENPRSREALRLLIAEASRFPALVDRHFEEFMEPVIEWLRGRLALARESEEISGRPLAEMPEVLLGPALALNIMMLLFANRRPLDVERFFQAHLGLAIDGLAGPAGSSGTAKPAGTAKPPDPHGPDRPAATADRDATGPAWTGWLPFPDPRRGAYLTAPAGPGLFELRLRSGEPVLLGTGLHVAARLTTLLPAEIKPEERASASRRRFLAHHLPELDYRTAAAATYGDAKTLAAGIDLGRHRFRSRA